MLFGVAFLVAWELAVAVFDWKEYFLPAPSVIWEAFVDNIDIVRDGGDRVGAATPWSACSSGRSSAWP